MNASRKSPARPAANRAGANAGAARKPAGAAVRSGAGKLAAGNAKSANVTGQQTPMTAAATKAPAKGAARSAGAVAPRRGRRAAAWSNVVASQDEQFRLKRNALLREAARAFSSGGFHNTSLDDVAAALGVTKAALYHYVHSKQEILFECHMMSLDLGDQALDHARRNGRTGLERLSMLARRYIELITGEMGRFAVLSEYDALTPENRLIIGRRRDLFEREMREMVEQGLADGTIQTVDPKLAVFFFMGAVNWMTRWFRPDGSHSGEAIAAGFSELFTRGLRAPA